MIRAILLALSLCWATKLAAELEPRRPSAPLPMMTNLAAVEDWSVQQPFINRMKTARPWIGHLPRRWGGVTAEDLAARGVLDVHGWPTHLPPDLGSIGTLILVDLPEEAQTLAGRYVLRFDGQGIVEVGGRATRVRYGPNEVSFDFSPGRGHVDIRIQRSNPQDYVRNITVIREDRLAAFAAGAVFNPDFLAAIDGFRGLRFMDWMRTNNSDLIQWQDRPLPDDYTYAENGVPLEVLLQLVARTGADPWITLPHKADDSFFRAAAELVRDARPNGATVWVEYSNEVWNWGFRQAQWADAQAQSRWGQDHQWMQFYGARAAQMAEIWREVFADTPDALTLVLGLQTGWLGLEEQTLHAPLWQAEGNPAPYTLFDAYAVTGYFGHNLGTPERADTLRRWLAQSVQDARARASARGLDGTAFETFLEAHRHDRAIALAAADLLDGSVTGERADTLDDLLTRILPYHARVAAEHGLDLVMYEGGTHVVGHYPVIDDKEITAFFTALNYSAEMGALYTHLFTGWAEISDAPFTLYTDVIKPSKWGSWGALRYLGDSNPRWDAIRAYLRGPDK